MTGRSVMGTTTILKNVLDRKPMVAFPTQYALKPRHFEVKIKDLENSQIIEQLYKADNQRSQSTGVWKKLLSLCRNVCPILILGSQCYIGWMKMGIFM